MDEVRLERTKRGNIRRLHYRDGVLFAVTADDENYRAELAAIHEEFVRSHWSYRTVGKPND